MSDKRTMNARPQRGRGTPAKPRGFPMPLFYALLALITIGGVALLLSNANGRATAPTAGKTIVSSVPLDSLPSRGNANAPVTVVEYADFQCPACGTFATTLEPGIVKDYIDSGKIKFVFHDFPLSQHKNAIAAAEAARAAGDQNAFWQMHDLLYTRQAEWQDLAQPDAQFLAYAQQLNLDTNAFSQSLSSHKHQAEILQARDAANKAGVDHTPTFTIDGKPYDMPDLRAAIDTALAAKK
jgi:protein-disulfide isomerase